MEVLSKVGRSRRLIVRNREVENFLKCAHVNHISALQSRTGVKTGMQQIDLGIDFIAAVMASRILPRSLSFQHTDVVSRDGAGTHTEGTGSWYQARVSGGFSAPIISDQDAMWRLSTFMDAITTLSFWPGPG